MASIYHRLRRALGARNHQSNAPRYQETATVTTQRSSKGWVLLAYIVKPFLLDEGESPSFAHTHHIEALSIAQAFLDLGYNVDVIDYRNREFVPTRHYAFFVSARTNFTTIAKHLNSDCIKIAHLDTAHFLFNNTAAYRRLLALQRRRGISTGSMKEIERNWAPEHADYLTVLGNEFTLGTYRYANKPMFSVPVPTPGTYASPEDKDFKHVRNRFLWLGSGGAVHKGLDLVLEACTELPDHHLTVCGPMDAPKERHFRCSYYHELYETANIHTIGWIDVGSQQFHDIARNCVGLIYPSSSEGQAGAVITCLRAGLIPLISYESGVDVHDFGIILDECTAGHIKETMLDLSNRPASELQKMAVKAWDYARRNHTPEKYIARYRQIIEEILADWR